MALETLEDVETINGNFLHRVEWNHPKDHFIEINDDANAITFKIQDGPIKENGVNGCQVDDMLHVTRRIIAELNKKYPCRENSCAITKIDEAIMWLRERTRERETRGVEGTSNG